MEKRVAIYARTSTNLQQNGLEAQVRALNEYCSRNQITNFVTFQDDGISGTKLSRPALDEMMAQARRGELSTIVVYSFSRFARSTSHLLAALSEFKKLGIAFKSVTEAIDTNSPLGQAFFTILACLAQLERDLISERVANGLRNARLKGRQIGRKKLRDSDLIRKLLKAGLTYRAVATIAKCSHGSVHSEYRVIKLEESEATRYETRTEEKRRIKAEKDLKERKTRVEGPSDGQKDA